MKWLGTPRESCNRSLKAVNIFLGGIQLVFQKRDGYKFSSHSQIQTWMKPTEHVYIRLYKKSFIGKGKLFHVHWFISLPSSLYLFGT